MKKLTNFLKESSIKVWINTIIIWLISILNLSFLPLNNQEWNEALKALDNPTYQGIGLEWTVEISGDLAIVGAPMIKTDEKGKNQKNGAGAAFIFERNGKQWNPVQKIVAIGRQSCDFFGFSVAIDNNHIIVGAKHQDYAQKGKTKMKGAGAAYIFENINGEWIQQQKIVASDRSEYDNFGSAVSIHGTYALVGAQLKEKNPNEIDCKEDVGAAYVFKLTKGHWVEQAKLEPKEEDSINFFGISVSICETQAIIDAFSLEKEANLKNDIEDYRIAYIYELMNEEWIHTQKLKYKLSPERIDIALK